MSLRAFLFMARILFAVCAILILLALFRTSRTENRIEEPEHKPSTRWEEHL